jgi:hypothetical protein
MIVVTTIFVLELKIFGHFLIVDGVRKNCKASINASKAFLFALKE